LEKGEKPKVTKFQILIYFPFSTTTFNFLVPFFSPLTIFLDYFYLFQTVRAIILCQPKERF